MEYLVAAEKILSQLSVKTNCFVGEKVVKAHYLVCIDDDITSAFYATRLYHEIRKVHGFYPHVICVGGFGPLSKFVNKKGESEGRKLQQTCIDLGVHPNQTFVLDKGSNTGLNCLEIYKLREPMPHVKTIFCLTQRLSLRVKQTFEFLDHQYPKCAKSDKLKIMIDSTYYFVPEQSLREQMQIYNCKGICGGILFFSEVASICDRIEKYSGKLQKPLDFSVPMEIQLVSKLMAKKYPLKINMKCWRSVWQFSLAFLYVFTHKWKIRKETWKAIEKEKSRIE